MQACVRVRLYVCVRLCVRALVQVRVRMDESMYLPVASFDTFIFARLVVVAFSVLGGVASM